MDTNDDWRLMGQEKHLKGVRLMRSKWVTLQEGWDHDHCEFCHETLCASTEVPAYCTEDYYSWICEECYQDFKESFGWVLVGALDCLKNARLLRTRWTSGDEEWDHNNCRSCMRALDAWTVEPAYCTEDRRYWICGECFDRRRGELGDCSVDAGGDDCGATAPRGSMATGYRHLTKEDLAEAVALLDEMRSAGRLDRKEQRLLYNALGTIEKNDEIQASFFQLASDIDGHFHDADADRHALARL